MLAFLRTSSPEVPMVSDLDLWKMEELETLSIAATHDRNAEEVLRTEGVQPGKGGHR